MLGIFSKNYNASKYDKCTYLSKGQQIGKFSNEIKNKLLASLISKKSNGEYNLCQAIKEMKEEAREEGIRQGEYLGKVKVLREINWTVEMIAKQINLSEQEVENIIQKIEKSEN